MTQEFKEVFKGYLAKVRDQKSLSPEQWELFIFLGALSGPLEAGNDNKNADKIFAKAKELNLSDSDLMLVWSDKIVSQSHVSKSRSNYKLN